MFSSYSKLSDIKGLEKWNVSNGNNFLFMFYGCSKLTDIKALEKWNVSKSLLNYIKKSFTYFNIKTNIHFICYSFYSLRITFIYLLYLFLFFF